MIRAIESNVIGLLSKKSIDDYRLDDHELLAIRWFKLLHQREALNSLVEMKLRISTLERRVGVRCRDQADEYVTADGLSGAIAFCAMVEEFFKENEQPFKRLSPNRFVDLDWCRDPSMHEPSCDVTHDMLSYVMVVQFLTTENQRRFEHFFKIDWYQAYEQLKEELRLSDLDLLGSDDYHPYQRVLKCLASYNEPDIPKQDLYLYYLEALSSRDYADTLLRLMDGQEGSLTQTLGAVLPTMMPNVVFDPLLNPVADLAFENLRESELFQTYDKYDWPSDGFDFETDYDGYVPFVIEHYESGARGTFARLFIEAASECDADVEIDVDTYEFDKGFCSLLAMAIHDYREFPEALQVEFFRMCHYVGLEVNTPLYDFWQRCDYETHVYEAPTTVEDLPLMDTIEIKGSSKVEFEVKFLFGEQVYLDEIINDPFWRRETKSFKDFNQAMAYARKLEKARREWVMVARPDDRFAQAELLDKCPKVTVVPVEA